MKAIAILPLFGRVFPKASALTQASTNPSHLRHFWVTVRAAQHSIKPPLA
jgi:hypothetical protein